MNVIIAGSTGMIGRLVLQHCLDTDDIHRVTSIVRKPGGLHHDKLQEVVLARFEDLSSHESIFHDQQAAFFCLGVYTGQVPDDQFRKITVDYPAAFGKALERNSPGATFCLLSGAGADRTEKSRTAFARYKGMAENQLAALALRFYSFRPGYIYPVERRREPNIGYRIMRALYPVIKALVKKYSIPSTLLARAMFHVGIHGANQQVLENRDIYQYI